jgi:hypothetical protein
MGIFVLTATYELRVSRKSHLRDHPSGKVGGWAKEGYGWLSRGWLAKLVVRLPAKTELLV